MKRNFLRAFILSSAMMTFGQTLLAFNGHYDHDHRSSHRGYRNSNRDEGRVSFLLGRTTLTDRLDYDKILLNKCRGGNNRNVREVQVRVRGAHADINTIELNFYGRRSQTLNIRRDFAPGTRSRWISVKGRKQCIKNIKVIGDSDLSHRDRRLGRRAVIEVFGR